MYCHCCFGCLYICLCVSVSLSTWLSIYLSQFSRYYFSVLPSSSLPLLSSCSLVPGRESGRGKGKPPRATHFTRQIRSHYLLVLEVIKFPGYPSLANCLMSSTSSSSLPMKSCPVNSSAHSRVNVILPVLSCFWRVHEEMVLVSHKM